MDWLTAVVEFVKALAWPLAIIFLGWYFKPQIEEILPRLKKAWGAEFFGPLVQQQKAVTTPPVPEHPLTQPPPVSLPIQKAEEAIRRDLEKISPPDQRQDALVRALARAQVAQFFENTYEDKPL